MNILPPVLQESRLSIFEQIYKERLEAISLDALMLSVLDTLPIAAMPLLGAQLDVMGFKGWELATTNKDKSRLLKDALIGHIYKGTRYGLTRAIQSVGFGGVDITEGIGLIYNGAVEHDGSATYADGGDWATFAVEVDLGISRGFDSIELDRLSRMIQEHKPARCRITSLSFDSNISESIPEPSNELLLAIGYNASENAAIDVHYNGDFAHNVTAMYLGPVDRLEYQIVPVAINNPDPS